MGTTEITICYQATQTFFDRARSSLFDFIRIGTVDQLEIVRAIHTVMTGCNCQTTVCARHGDANACLAIVARHSHRNVRVRCKNYCEMRIFAHLPVVLAGRSKLIWRTEYTHIPHLPTARPTHNFEEACLQIKSGHDSTSLGDRPFRIV